MEGIASQRNRLLTPAPPWAENAAVETGAAHRIVVVEDHPLFREGVSHCLSAEQDLDVVGSFATGGFDTAALAAMHPDVVLMDVELPECNGIEATRRIRSALPDVRVVMLTAFADADLLFGAMEAGASGYVLKHTLATDLVASVRRIIAGEHVLTPELASRFLRAFQGRRPPGDLEAKIAQLSPREDEVLKLLATGETNSQIARRLFVSEETIKSHVAAIFRKLEVRDRTRAALLAVKAGLVVP